MNALPWIFRLCCSLGPPSHTSAYCQLFTQTNWFFYSRLRFPGLLLPTPTLLPSNITRTLPPVRPHCVYLLYQKSPRKVPSLPSSPPLFLSLYSPLFHSSCKCWDFHGLRLYCPTPGVSLISLVGPPHTTPLERGRIKKQSR